MGSLLCCIGLQLVFKKKNWLVACRLPDMHRQELRLGLPDAPHWAASQLDEVVGDMSHVTSDAVDDLVATPELSDHAAPEAVSVSAVDVTSTKLDAEGSTSVQSDNHVDEAGSGPMTLEDVPVEIATDEAAGTVDNVPVETTKAGKRSRQKKGGKK
jgi:hypothetical protein